MAQSVSNILSNTNANSTSPYLKSKTTKPTTTATKPPIFGIPNKPSQALVNMSIQNSPKNNVPMPANSYSMNINRLLTPSPNVTSNGQSNQNAPIQAAVTPGEQNRSQIDNLMQQAQGIQSQISQLPSIKPLLPTPNTSQFAEYLKNLQNQSKVGADQKRNLAALERTAAGNKAIGDKALALSEQYGSEIARIGQLGAGAVAGNLSTGSNVVGSGNAAIASQSASSRMSALSQAQQAALAGTGQQLTANSQEANALTNALTGANTQQAQGITGLSNVAQFGQPVQIAPGNTLSSPVGGETIAGGLGGYVNYNTAQQVMGLISQYPDAGYAYDQNLSPQQNLAAAQAAIQSSPTYQRSTYGTPGQSSVAGATAVQTAQSGYQQSYQAYNQLETQVNNADQLGANLLTVMQSSGINPTDARYANSKIKQLQRQFNDTQRAAFDTALKEVQAAYGNIIISGGGTIPTEATEAYNTILNPDASLGAIMASMEQLKLAGHTKLQMQGQQVNNYWSQLQSAGQQQGGSSAGGGGSNPFAEAW